MYHARLSSMIDLGRSLRVGGELNDVTTSKDLAEYVRSAGRGFGAKAWLLSWSLSSFWAVTLLALLEAYWAHRLGLHLDLATGVSAWVMLTSLVVVGSAAVLGCAAICRRFWPARAGWLFAVLLSPWAWITAESLLSGNRVSAMTGVGLVKVVFALGLVLALRFAIAVSAEVARGPRGAVRWGWTLLTAVALVGGSWADNRVQVGLYPAFHLVAGAVVLLAAVLLARLWSPRAGPDPACDPGVSQLTGSALVIPVIVMGCALCPWWGTDADADKLVSFTNGLLPKARRSAVWASQAITARAVHQRDDQGQRDRGTATWAAPPPRNLLSDSTSLNGDSWVGAGAWSAVDRGRWTVPGGSGEVAQLLSRKEVAGHGLEVSLAVRVVSRGASEPTVPATAVLAIDDLGNEQGQRASQTLSAEWAELTVTLDETSAPTPTSSTETRGERDVHDLDPGIMSPGEGLSWSVPVPSRWRALANNSEQPSGVYPLMLLEDGHELGPVCPMHQTIRDVGGGLYSHWSDSLIFSTSDDSDPRSNGRKYSLVDPSYLKTAVDDGGLRVSLTVDGLRAQDELEIRGFSATSALPQDPRQLSLALSGEFAFVPTEARAMEVARSQTQNVILVVLDALRDDHVGPDENGVSLTPHIDALADEGLRFATAYSPSDHTGRSIPSVVTGLPLQVILDAADQQRPLQTFLERLADAGLSTYYNGSDYILQKYRHLPIKVSFGAEQFGGTFSKSDELAAEVMSFVEAQDGEPFAVYTHWSYAHVGRSKDMPGDYARAVTHADQKVGELIAGLREAGAWDNTLLIVTADHGYALGEGFRFLGAHGCGERSLRVPLVMHVPGLEEQGQQVDEVVSLLALVPSMLDLLAPRSEGLMADRSLFSLLLDERDPRRLNGGTAFADMGFSFMTRRDGTKLAEDDSLRTAMLFNPQSDPGEVAPLRDTALLIELQQLRASEWARQARLSQALIAADAQGLAPEVLLAFQARRGAVADVGALLERAWLYNEATRAYLFEQVLQRELVGQGAALDSLVRESFDGADQEILVMRAWAQSPGALVELEARYGELGSAARLLLADLALKIDFSSVPGLVDLIADDALSLWASGVQLESLDERRVALALTAVAAHRPAETLGPIKDIMVELFNRWSVGREPGLYFSCQRTRKFTPRYLLNVFWDKPLPDDLARVEKLLRNRFFAEVVPEMCRRLDSEEARDWLLNELEHWSARDEDPPGKFLTSVVPTLRKFEDAAYRQRANDVIQARFPALQTVDP